MDLCAGAIRGRIEDTHHVCYEISKRNELFCAYIQIPTAVVPTRQFGHHQELIGPDSILLHSISRQVRTNPRR